MAAAPIGMAAAGPVAVAVAFDVLNGLHDAANAIATPGATWRGVPVSTTHNATGAVKRVGAVRSFCVVRWGVARGILVAWVIALPAAALIGAGAYRVATWIVG
jgi:PiT family inorganic phosphate transporter